MDNKRIKGILLVILLIIISLKFLKPYSVLRYKYNYLLLKDEIDSLNYISSVEGKYVPQKSLDILNDFLKSLPLFDDSYSENSYIICSIFSTIGCSTCLEEEVKNINNIYSILKKESIKPNVIGLVYSDKKAEVIRFKRISNIHFPIFIDESKDLINYLKLKSFPVIILIDRRTGFIFKANYPVKGNVLWSKIFSNYVLSLLSKKGL